jgi:hypothetical protein
MDVAGMGSAIRSLREESGNPEVEAAIPMRRLWQATEGIRFVIFVWLVLILYALVIVWKT